MTSTEIDAYFSDVVAEFLGSLLSLGFFIFVIGIGTMIGIAALITWVVKKVWNAGNNSNKTKKEYNPENEDRLTRAKRNEDTKFDYSNRHQTPDRGGYAGNPKEGIKWYPSGWYFDEKTQKWTPPDYVEESPRSTGNLVYNERARMWVNQDQCDPIENQRRYEENRRKWENFKEQEVRKEETRSRIEAIINNTMEYKKSEKDKMIKELHCGQYDRYSGFTDEELKLILQAQCRHKPIEPTYEEWKAAREKDNQNNA